MKKERNIFRGIVAFAILPLLALVDIVLAGVLVSKLGGYELPIITACISLYVSFAIIFGVLTSVTGKKRKAENSKKGPVLGNVMYDKINYANEPAFICDENHKIVWVNRFGATQIGAKKTLGASINTIFPYDFSAGTSKKHKEIRVELNGETYTVEETKIDTPSEQYYLLYLSNVTKQAELEKLQRDKEKIVAYIVVDNLDALFQFEQEQYRETAAKVEKIVRSSVESVNGIIKEYEKDKYVAIFNMEDLDKFINDNFSVLDKVRDIRLGSGSIPVTLSIGVAKMAEASLAEKEKLAHIALDMALQRGGDQAVVKLEDEVLFFGGRTNAVQKRTKVRARVVANELAMRISQASNVIIMAHAFPD